MDTLVLPFSAPLTAHQRQAGELLDAHRAADPRAIQIFHGKHLRFLDDEGLWLPKRIPDSAIRDAALTIEDAQLAVARVYDVQNGDASALVALIEANPQIVHVRSIRRTHFDPPVHRATLLHYVAANGVEGFRQKTPENAVEIARVLLKDGAEPNSLASLYGGECTTMTLLVSSCHPAEAGLAVRPSRHAGRFRRRCRAVRFRKVEIAFDDGARVRLFRRGRRPRQTWPRPPVSVVSACPSNSSNPPMPIRAIARWRSPRSKATPRSSNFF